VAEPPDGGHVRLIFYGGLLLSLLKNFKELKLYSVRLLGKKVMSG